MGCSGHPVVRTPHLDALAFDGVRFDRAYSNCPVCIPARTSLITGRAAHRYGMPAYNEDFRIDHPKDQFLGSLLTRAGYQTHLAGKTHWHTEPQFRAGFEGISWMSLLRRERLVKSGRPTTLDGVGFNEMSTMLSELPPELQITNWVVDRSLDFLDTRDREQPFFLWASFQDPHPPLSIHAPFYDMYRGEKIPPAIIPEWCDREDVPISLYHHRWSWNPKPLTDREIEHAREVYYGMITNLDYQLGRLFAKLMLDGDWENTLIIYLSDHGEHLGDHGDLGKTTFLESSARIPLILRPPESVSHNNGAVSAALADITDLLPTICDYSGAELPELVDGCSLRGIVEGTSESVRECLHGQLEDMHMWHTGEYKYLYFADDGRELVFNADQDPNDTTMLEGPIVQELREQFIMHLKSEGHPHLSSSGELLNRGLKRRSKNELAAENIRMQGLSPCAIYTDMLKHVTWIN